MSPRAKTFSVGYAALLFASVFLGQQTSACSQTVATPTEPSRVLSGNSALKERISIRPHFYIYQRLFQTLSQRKGIRLGSRDAELSGAKVFIACDKQPLHAVMDAMAAMFLVDWSIEDRYYYLEPGKRSLDEGFMTNNPFMKDRLEIGTGFIRSIGKLDDTQKRQVLSPGGNGFSSLPNDLRESIERMATNMVDEYNAQGKEGVRSIVADLSQTRVRVDPKSAPVGITEYFITIENDRGSMGWRIHNYDEVRKRLDQAAAGATLEIQATRYRTIKYELSPDDAKRQPVAQKVVTLHERNVTFPQIMRILFERYGISFVTELPATMPERANVGLGPLPLGEVLDRLTQLYKGTEWELRRSGFVIVRGPLHPGRDVQKDKNPSIRSTDSPGVPEPAGSILP